MVYWRCCLPGLAMIGPERAPVQFFVRERLDSTTRMLSGTVLGWDVVECATGEVVPGHADYDFVEDAIRAAARLDIDHARKEAHA